MTSPPVPQAPNAPDSPESTWLCKDFAPALFYFCLKKTHNLTDAQDLAQHTLEQVLASLQRCRSLGSLPDDLSAWSWRLAWNHYSRWVKGQVRERHAIKGADIADIADFEPVTDEACNRQSEADPAELLLTQETLSLLGRELAFTAREYRRILTGFYIDDKSIPQLALELGMKEGTVKTRLAKSRRQLKEGMDMARTFGPRSYNPQDINFTTSGIQPDNVPWKFLGRRFSNNILLEAHNNPSSLQDLALSLGVALPYVEDEVATLAEAGLLVPVDNNLWLTNFYIADRDLQVHIHKTLQNGSPGRTATLMNLIDSCMNDVRNTSPWLNALPCRDLRWLLILNCTDWLNGKVARASGWDGTYTPRPKGGAWDIIGLEICPEITEPVFVGQNGRGDYRGCLFSTYKISDWNLWERAGEMVSPEIELLGDILSKHRTMDSLSEHELNTFKGIRPRFVHVEGSSILPDIAVFQGDQESRISKRLQSEPAWAELEKEWATLNAQVKNLLARRSSPYLTTLNGYYSHEFMSNLRMLVLRDAVRASWLDIPEEPEKSTIAMSFTIP